MTELESRTLESVGKGVAAGIAGTLLMFGARTFDQQYASKTMTHPRQDPGFFAMRKAEWLAGLHKSVPHSLEDSGAFATHLSYGALFGALYAMWRGRKQRGSALGDGIAVGLFVYGFSYLGLLPVLGLLKPVWKQTYPQVVGEIARHLIYGIGTAASFGLIGGRE